MLRRVLVVGMCLVAAPWALAQAWVAGVHGAATDDAGRLLIHASALSPELEAFVRQPEPYPAVFVVTDAMRVYYAQDGSFSSMAYAHFFDSGLLRAPLTVRIEGSARIEALMAYQARARSAPDDVPVGGPLVCTVVGGAMRCQRGAEVVYRHECSFDPVGQTLVCRFD